MNRETVQKGSPRACSIAYFISPHGYGHGTRSLAVMEAIRKRKPDTHFHIYTRFPVTLIEESLQAGFTYTDLACDLGLAQKSALEINFPASLEGLARLIPFEDSLVERLADGLRQSRCRLVICDIAALGIAVAHKAGIASVLVENFTWDFIYKAYVDDYPQFGNLARYLAHWYDQASLHIQTTPVSRVKATALQADPVARPHRLSRKAMRARLGIGDEKLVLLTMGGIRAELPFLQKLSRFTQCRFALPGVSGCQGSRVLDAEVVARCYHPDLVRAADVVVGKLGYSTVAEVYEAGVPFGFVARLGFRESDSLARFCSAAGNGLALSEAQFADGSWLDRLPHLLGQTRNPEPVSHGAGQVADFILTMLKDEASQNRQDPLSKPPKDS